MVGVGPFGGIVVDQPHGYCHGVSASVLTAVAVLIGWALDVADLLTQAVPKEEPFRSDPRVAITPRPATERSPVAALRTQFDMTCRAVTRTGIAVSARRPAEQHGWRILRQLTPRAQHISRSRCCRQKSAFRRSQSRKEEGRGKSDEGSRGHG